MNAIWIPLVGGVLAAAILFLGPLVIESWKRRRGARNGTKEPRWDV